MSEPAGAGPDLVRVHVANGHETSGGRGPGEVVIPRTEAQRIVAARCGHILGPAGSAGDPADHVRARGVTN